MKRFKQSFLYAMVADIITDNKKRLKRIIILTFIGVIGVIFFYLATHPRLSSLERYKGEIIIGKETGFFVDNEVIISKQDGQEIEIIRVTDNLFNNISLRDTVK